MSKCNLLEALRREEIGLTQRELAEETGLSAPTVRERAEDLKSAGKLKIVEVGGCKLHIPVEVDSSAD
jgi:DNA-binding Lrp family transcriptional regulator